MSTRTCPHGERQERSGISKRTGRPYRGLFCVDSTCDPVWLEPVNGSDNLAEIRQLMDQVARMKKERDLWRDNYYSATRRTATSRSTSTPAVYSDKVAKLLNLAVAASTDSEASAAFMKARSLHAKEVSK